MESERKFHNTYVEVGLADSTHGKIRNAYKVLARKPEGKRTASETYV
jgi:hypothetical protein